MTPDDSGMSQRERRRQQHASSKPKVALNKGDLKKWTGPAILLLIVGGIVTAMVVTEQNAPDCPGHWHAAYSVWTDGERVPFTNPAFESSDNTWAPGTHIHGNDGVYHFHPAIEKCIPMADALQHLDVDLSEDSLVLGTAHGARAGTYDQAPVRLFHQAWGADMDDTWQEVTEFSSVLDAQPANGDGFAIIYGEHTPEEIDAILAQSASMKGNPNYDPHYIQPGS